tara:strand:+ start:1247 stop:2599 length:1353 start_codon:yes stop_codon:yes gene_type:complete
MRAFRKDIITKYLRTYAEPEAELAGRFQCQADHVLVVPAQDESISLLDGFRPALDAASNQGSRALCIVVVNTNDTHPRLVQERNAELIHAFRDYGPTVALHTGNETPGWHMQADGFDVIVVDRNSSGFQLPSNQGVGLARKIGCDLALAAIHNGVNKVPLIHMTDCDVRLPNDYFSPTIPISCAGLIYRFSHNPSGDSTIDNAHALYEAYLRYYVLGLQYAGSPYAFHTIGSCIAVSPTAYAAVRGVPKRQAGEDFYLLNKLAKVGGIYTANTTALAIQARASLRVPFGTGQATNEIMQKSTIYKIYDPGVFDLLKTWCNALKAINGTTAHTAYETVRSHAEFGLDTVNQQRLRKALEVIGAPTALMTAAAQSPTTVIRQKWLTDWFDAFRTLKLVHALRQTGLPDVPWFQALHNAPFSHSAFTNKHPENITTTEAFNICQRLASLEEQC